MSAVVVSRAFRSVLVAACAVFLAGTATAGVVTRTYDFPQPVVKLVDGYHSVAMDGVWSFGAPGEPVLPVAAARLLLPPGERIRDVRVVPGEAVVLGAGYLVEPGQPQYPLSFVGPIVEVGPDYAASGRSSYPGRLNDDAAFGLFRGHGIANVALHPVEYRPSDGSLAWYPTMTVEITTEPDPSVMEAARRGVRRDESTVERLRDLIDNAGADAAYSLLGRETPASRLLDPEPAYRYLIITTESWDEYLTGYADFQTQRGFRAGIFLRSWIVANYEGADDQARIRSFIADAYNTWDAEYVLLVGDAMDESGIPHRGLCADGFGTVDSDIPSDLYYAALDGSWNADGDFCWGEPGEEDLYAEVAVGRACASSAAQVQNFVTKTMRYANSPVVAESDEALMVGELLWTSPLTYGDTSKDEVRYGSTANGYTTVGFVPGTTDLDFLYDTYGTWTKTALIGLMESGTNIVNHLGHCNVQYAMRMYTADISQFDNDGTTHSLNFVYGQGCYCGAFDNCTPDGVYIGDCFAEQFTCDDDGAVAVIMNSRYGWGDPGGTNGSSQYFDREFFDAFFNEHIWFAGEANNDSKADNVWAINYGANRWCCYQTNLFGDPALQVWTDEPVAMVVDHPSAVVVGQPDMEIAVSVPVAGPVAGARVTIWTDDYSVYDTGVTDAAGLLTLQPDASLPDTLHLKVWAHDHLVYDDDIVIAPATGPFVVLEGCAIDDDEAGGSHGNGDGVVNAGETVELIPTLENVGSITASAVAAALTSGSAHITVTDGDGLFGDIAPLATADAFDTYTFVVAGGTPNGTVASFDLGVSETAGERYERRQIAIMAREAWESGFNLTVAAPVLAYAGHEADDPMYAGNGNGCLDAGETIQIVVSLANTGSAAATNVTATLSSSDPYVRVNEAERSVASIAAGATEALDASYSVTLLPECPAFREIEFALSVSADWGYASATGFRIMSSGGDIVDDAESGEGEWTHASVTGGFLDEWHIDSWRSRSTGHSWKFGAEADAPYSDSADGALVMRPTCLGPDAELTFWDWLDCEEENPMSAWDCGLVEITTDGGATWDVVEPVGGYSHLKNVNAANPLPEGTPCWSGSHEWRLETFDLSAYSGETVQIRFRFASDGYVTYEGWYIDDILLTSTPTAFVAGDAPPLTLALDQNVPNPFNPVTTIRYTLPGAADVRVEVYNAAGRLVRTLVDGRQEAGQKATVWDGTNDLGQKVASGVYMYRLTADGRVCDGRMVLLK